MTARLVITIDTEPDDQWVMPSGGIAAPLTFANTRDLRRLIDFLREIGAPATWLTSYSVARDDQSVRMLRDAAADGDEIGGHLHAWETPPLTASDLSAHPYIYEYDSAIRLEKLRTVTAALEDAFGQRPVSYRAGRWGIDDREYENLAAEGYAIDTSVVPGHDFSPSRGLERGGPDFRGSLQAAPFAPYRVGRIWEVPVSVATLGLLGSMGSGMLGARLASSLANRRDLPSRVAGRGLAAAGLCRIVWLRPLMHPRDEVVAAARSMMRRGAGLINIMFHSSETCAGTSPRSRHKKDVDRFYGDMRAIVEALRSEGDVQPCTLRDAVMNR